MLVCEELTCVQIRLSSRKWQVSAETQILCAFSDLWWLPYCPGGHLAAGLLPTSCPAACEALEQWHSEATVRTLMNTHTHTPRTKKLGVFSWVLGGWKGARIKVMTLNLNSICVTPRLSTHFDSFPPTCSLTKKARVALSPSSPPSLGEIPGRGTSESQRPLWSSRCCMDAALLCLAVLCHQF